MRNPKTPNAAITCSSECVASIDDLLTNILLLLPIKSLIRFKLVSKHWLSLITTHSFCLRRNPIPNPPIGLFLSIKDENRYNYKYIPLYPTQNPNPPPFSLNFTTNPSKTDIVHSCNGLFLCCSSQSWDGSDRDILHQSDCLIYVYNPTTNSSVAIPDTPRYLHGATLVFDPAISPHYKIVLAVFVWRGRERGCEIKVFSSETGRWSTGVELDEYRCADVHGNGVYWNGSVHWLNSELCVGQESEKKSIRFNVDAGVVVEMLTPPVICDHMWSSDYYFGESCGHMHSVEHTLPRLSIYEMKMDYSEWFLKFEVDVTCILDAFPEVIEVSFLQQVNYVGYVLSVVRGDGDEASLVLRIPGKAVRYSLVDGTSEKLRDFVHDIVQHEIHFLGADDNDAGVEETYEFQNECGFDYIQSLCSC